MSALEKATQISGLSFDEIISVLIKHFTFKEIVFLQFDEIMEAIQC
jgi:hypothetical protein